jgi:hypothetical protein
MGSIADPGRPALPVFNKSIKIGGWDYDSFSSSAAKSDSSISGFWLCMP